MRAIDFFDRGVFLDPDRLCLKDASVARTYREVHARSCRIANAMRRDGVRPQDKAAVYSPNAAVAFECVLGILRAGAVWVPINARNVVSENAYILDYCDVETLFYYSGFEGNVAVRTSRLGSAPSTRPIPTYRPSPTMSAPSSAPAAPPGAPKAECGAI